MKNILKLEEFSVPKIPNRLSLSDLKKMTHKQNIRNIVDENNSLHRRSVNGIIGVIKDGGLEFAELPYEIPYKLSPIVSVDRDGFAYTKDDNHLDLMGLPTTKLIEIYESLVY